MSDYADHPLYGEAMAQHAGFLQEIDAITPESCSRDRLVRMIEAAPTERSRAYLWGIFDTRAIYAEISNAQFCRSRETPGGHLNHPVHDNLNVSGSRLRFALDALDPTTCARDSLDDMLGQAPDALTQAYLLGIREVRLIYSMTANGTFHRE